jgi:hypothetical protein
VRRGRGRRGGRSAARRSRAEARGGFCRGWNDPIDPPCSALSRDRLTRNGSSPSAICAQWLPNPERPVLGLRERTAGQRSRVGARLGVLEDFGGELGNLPGSFLRRVEPATIRSQPASSRARSSSDFVAPSLPWTLNRGRTSCYCFMTFSMSHAGHIGLLNVIISNVND